MLIYKKKKKRICSVVDFAFPADYRLKIQESFKRQKNLDLAREIRKLWNMKVTVIANVIGTLGTIDKGSKRGLEELETEGRIETI